MYKMGLDEKEVKVIGERRWLRHYWKKMLALIGGLFVVALCASITLSVLDVGWRVYVIIPLLVIWGVVYILSMRRMKKAGRGLLATMKEKKQEV